MTLTSKSIRRTVFLFAVAGVVLAWAVLGATLVLDTTRPVRLVAAFAAALATEGLFWLGVGLLGWSAVDRRQALWHWITGGRAANGEVS
ncbi:hypothetical protein [Marinicauda sp. Alg238-R41]|uniref:hypothetical protein n=1 Tax=Marinicauda sp. Alg238-R41 TaxID=2993447 RepID=UPI0022E5262F|nr:hypothetical protein [Marinicauda sp. Alg238-R41]